VSRRRRRRLLVCYADPPYPGNARLYPEREEVDHAWLVDWLCREFPDGWALSTSSVALREVLATCPPDVRVGAWVKPFCSWKPGARVQHAWEPVLFRPARPPARSVRDWLSCPMSMRRGVIGAKPEAFCAWLFEVLGLRRGDRLVDLYPGSGAVTRAWRAFKQGRG
jgi:hypothetical protein